MRRFLWISLLWLCISTPLCWGGAGDRDGGKTSVYNGLGAIGTAASRQLSSCPANKGKVPGTCFAVNVAHCPETPGLNPTVTVKVSMPNGTPIGTVVFTTGGGGEGNFYDKQFSGGETVVNGVLAAGYIAVQLSFNGFDGWMNGPSQDGPLALACRHATVTQWIYSNIHQGGNTAPLCATGNSGGSAAIAYELADYGYGTPGASGAAFYSMVEATSGPPTGRLDVGCLCQAPPVTSPPCNVVTTQCYGNQGRAGAPLFDDSYGNTACTSHDPSFSQQWINDSLAGQFGNSAYPATDVHLLFGSLDTSAAVPLGMAWATQIATRYSVACAINAPHNLPNNTPAANQVLSDLVTYCRLQPPVSAVNLSPNSLSFGDVSVGGSSAPQSVTLSNVGTGTLNIASITASGDYSQTNTCGGSVTVGGSCSISVTFAPTTTGARTGQITIADDAFNSPQTVSLSGNGVAPPPPQVSLAPSNLSFGNQLVGTTSSAQTVTLTNTGGSVLTITSLAASGDFAETDNCVGSFAPGAGCSVAVTFTPTEPGIRSGAITFNDNAPDSPQNLPLSGTGVTSSHNAVPQVNQPLAPSSVAPGSTDFTLTVNGAGFVNGAWVSWNGAPLATTFVTSRQVTATVPASDVAAAGSAVVAVVNPGAGGGPSNPELFEVTSPTSAVNLASSTLTVLSAPQAVLLADFNGDGKADAAVANSGSANLSVFLGNSDGTFGTRQDNATGNGPNFVAAADFNGDGKVDLAVANRADGTVSILLGNGDGSFQGHTDLPCASGASAIAVGDFNLDGSLDVAVSNDAGTVSILLGNGDGSFQGHVDYPTGASPLRIIAADLNGDGVLDLATADYNCPSCSPGQVSVLLGNGDGSFQGHVEYDVGTNPGSLAVADLNGDGKLDLLATNANCVDAGCTQFSPGTVSVLIGNGDGSFTSHLDYGVGQEPASAVMGDFNGDGKLDVATANRADNTASLLLGNGDGTFAAQTVFSAGSAPVAIAAADLNQDGRLDLGVVNLNDSTLATMLQAPIVSLSTNALSFADQAVGTTSAAQPVTLTNTGSGLLKITSLAVTGDFAETDNCVGTLAPAASCTINVTFTPTSTGTRTGSVSINDNAAGSPQSIALTGNGVPGQPAVGLNPTSLSFPTTLLRNTSTQSVTLNNTGTAALSISSIVINGTDPGDYSQINTCGTSVPLGGSCTITVTFKPLMTGSRPAQVAITDNAPGSPQTVMLKGMGTIVTLTPDSLTFDAQTVGTSSSPQSVSLTNTSKKNLNFSQIKITGTNASDFSQDNTCGSSIGPNATCAILVTFTPTATGSRVANLSISDNGGGSPQLVPLSGTGQ